jgi:hypothetical protein
MYDWMKVKFQNKRYKTTKVYSSRLAAVVIKDKRRQSWQESYLLVYSLPQNVLGLTPCS